MQTWNLSLSNKSTIVLSFNEKVTSISQELSKFTNNAVWISTTVGSKPTSYTITSYKQTS